MIKLRLPNFEKFLSNLAIIYLMFGLAFALYYAYYYHWEWFGYFSPNFFLVLISWPYQAIGFSSDILYYGPAGKPI